MGFASAEYIELARAKDARVAVVNTDRDEEPAGGFIDDDCFPWPMPLLL